MGWSGAVTPYERCPSRSHDASSMGEPLPVGLSQPTILALALQSHDTLLQFDVTGNYFVEADTSPQRIDRSGKPFEANDTVQPRFREEPRSLFSYLPECV